MLEMAGLSAVQGANIMSVDIQPEYQDALDFNLYDYLDFLNQNIENINSLTFLYNGEDTMGMVSENEYKYWLVDNGFEEENLYYCRFYDKGYAFFRYCMDEGIEEDDIVMFVQYMLNNNINDSREITTEVWNDFIMKSDIDESDIRNLLENADDMLNIPDLMEYLRTYGGKIVLTGGGINECLKEVEIALMALDKPYNVLTEYTY
ncbi:MAG: cell division protein FtsA [Candidatus Odinarchaeia archaeon]